MAATRRIEQKAATREKLIAAARDVFKAQGYEATGMREVAKAAGLSTGAIFGHFADKAELFMVATGRKPPPDRVREWLQMELRGEAFIYSRDVAKQLFADLYGTPVE